MKDIGLDLVRGLWPHEFDWMDSYQLAMGLINNLVRPILVNKCNCLPDYIVMITRAGGMAT